MGIEGSQFCTNPLPPSPCSWSTWLISPLEHPLRSSGSSLTQAQLTCGCPASPVPVQPVVSTNTLQPTHLLLALNSLLHPWHLTDTYLLCLQIHTKPSILKILQASGKQARLSPSSMDLGQFRDFLALTPFG